MCQRKEILDKDPFLYQVNAKQSKGRDNSLVKLGDDDLILLPRRVFAYTLVERNSFLVDTRCLKPIKEQRDIFKRPGILKEYKEIGKYLVASYFVNKDLEKL
jgi:hypothetical protein